MPATAPGEKYAVRLTYADGFGVDEQFAGPWAAEHAAAFFAHAVTVPGAVTVWLTRSLNGPTAIHTPAAGAGRAG